MADPFLAQITLFAGNFAPRGWAFCEGQLIAIMQEQAVFSLLGTMYGGDGRTSFALPDLRGRCPIQPGHGPGLSTRQLGQKGGAENSNLTVQNLPSHTHATSSLKVQQPASSSKGNETSPVGNYPAVTITGKGSTAVTDTAYHNSAGSGQFLGESLVTGGLGNTGNGQSFNNMPPFLGVNYIIALRGVFPSRN